MKKFISKHKSFFLFVFENLLRAVVIALGISLFYELYF